MMDIPGSNCSVKQIDTNRYYDLKTTNQFFVVHSPLKRESDICFGYGDMVWLI